MEGGCRLGVHLGQKIISRASQGQKSIFDQLPCRQGARKTPGELTLWDFWNAEEHVLPSGEKGGLVRIWWKNEHAKSKTHLMAVEKIPPLNTNSQGVGRP